MGFSYSHLLTLLRQLSSNTCPHNEWVLFTGDCLTQHRSIVSVRPSPFLLSQETEMLPHIRIKTLWSVCNFTSVFTRSFLATCSVFRSTTTSKQVYSKWSAKDDGYAWQGGKCSWKNRHFFARKTCCLRPSCVRYDTAKVHTLLHRY